MTPYLHGKIIALTLCLTTGLFTACTHRPAATTSHTPSDVEIPDIFRAKPATAEELDQLKSPPDFSHIDIVVINPEHSSTASQP